MFLLSLEDKSLSLALNGRDPLGTQAIWQFRARDVVPALTAASGRAEGFQLLVTALAWFPLFAQRHQRPATDLKRYFLLVEQAFARAWKTAGEEDWPLPGKRRLSGNERGIWVGLDPKRHFLIDSPLANGTWGIYRGPLLNARVVDTTNLLADSGVEETIRRATPVMKNLFDGLAKALREPPGVQIELAQRSSHSLVQGLVEVLKRLPSKALLRSKLVAPAHHPITRDLAEQALRHPDDPVEALVLRALHELSHWRVPLNGVVRCERYLAALDASFEQLCALVIAGEKDPYGALTMDLVALRRAQADFAVCGSFRGLADQRRLQLLQAPTASAAALGAFLLQHHAAISEERGSAPWISESDNRRLACRVEVHEPQERQLQPGTAWRNGYYLDALRSLARGVGTGGR